MQITIFGAGAIGNYIGLQCHKSGHAVTFKGSDRVVRAIEKNGFSFAYPDDQTEHYPPGTLTFTTDSKLATETADLLIIAVKSLLTDTIINELQPHLNTNTVLLTLQNGVSNGPRLKEAFPGNTVLSGMVTFNVVELNDHTFRLSTSGEIYLEQHVAIDLQTLFCDSELIAISKGNITGVLWSKLLLNLINPLNALSGQPLKTCLEDRSFRKLWCRCMREGLEVLKAAGIQTEKVTPLPTHFLPFMIGLPNAIYLRMAQNMTDMDPTAKSSMAQDFEKGKQTEIDYLSGEIISLGKQLGVPTPTNQQVYNTIKKLEQTGLEKRSDAYSTLLAQY